ncbi:carboxymuconolactone decarboxylase family protein [Siccirubricoccus deserti]
MKKTLFAATVASLALITPALAQITGANTVSSTSALPSALTRDEVRSVAPALERYGRETLLDRLWRRPDLSPRDRSLVTLAALIARGQAAELPTYVNLALDSGVKPSEVSEVVTHLAFYAGWGNAMAAVAAVREIFAARGIEADQLPAASPPLLPLDEAGRRSARPGWPRASARSPRAWTSSRPTSCSAISGCARTSRQGIGASSRSAP